ncbi:hypothetical protein DPMN_082322 [Dreissena polymorpha]|uniref:Uncharacterized protein n=1 Tax=Dreissena polymorpha TaxID=45954 RepID=A0A9D4BA16_DREPO|nr:hypothetical protein DPMN_082322 [Dreissena polymorpha]
MTQCERVQRSHDAVDTALRVVRSSWTWRTWINFEHVQNLRDEDVVKSGHG